MRSTPCTDNTIGAIIVGGDYQGLGIVRSLGLRNIPVCVIDDEHSISKYSKYASFVRHFPDLRKEENVINAIRETAKEFNLHGWVLFPTRDETVAAFSKHREELSPQFRVPTPAWNSVQWAWDKRNTYKLAERLNIPSPKTCYPSGIQDLDHIDFGPPYVVKPAIKEHFFYKTRAKAWRANSLPELRELFTAASALTGDGEVIVQEYLAGGSELQYAYCAFYKNGGPVGSMVVRRRRQHPYEFGRASTFVETVDCPFIEDYSKQFLEAIHYYGLVEIEFKQDLRTKQFKLHDVNLRTWGYHSLGRTAGVDFPAMLFADQIGEVVVPCQGKLGIKWIRMVTDMPASFTQLATGHLPLKEYLASFKGPLSDAVFCKKDPLPGLAEILLIPYLYYKRGF
jgi:D-aspartate ligase